MRLKYILSLIAIYGLSISLQAQDTLWVDRDRYAELDFGRSDFYHNNGELAVRYIKKENKLRTKEWDEAGRLTAKSFSRRKYFSKERVFSRTVIQYDNDGHRTVKMYTKMKGCSHIWRVRKKTY